MPRYRKPIESVAPYQLQGSKATQGQRCRPPLSSWSALTWCPRPARPHPDGPAGTGTDAPPTAFKISQGIQNAPSRTNAAASSYFKGSWTRDPGGVRLKGPGPASGPRLHRFAARLKPGCTRRWSFNQRWKGFYFLTGCDRSRRLRRIYNSPESLPPAARNSFHPLICTRVPQILNFTTLCPKVLFTSEIWQCVSGLRLIKLPRLFPESSFCTSFVFKINISTS